MVTVDWDTGLRRVENDRFLEEVGAGQALRSPLWTGGKGGFAKRLLYREGWRLLMPLQVEPCILVSLILLLISGSSLRQKPDQS